MSKIIFHTTKGYGVDADFNKHIHDTQQLQNIIKDIKPIEERLSKLGYRLKLEALTQKNQNFLDSF